MIKVNNTRKKLANFTGAVCASLLCLSGAIADDTEVFFGQVDPELDIFPNVLFVLDTSGSMNFFDHGAQGSRLERMKEALGTILDNTANVNVGLMRFNGSSGGGAVLYPVSPIDREVCALGQCGDQSAAPQINNGNNDIEINLDRNTVVTNGRILDTGVVNTTQTMTGLRFTSLNIPQGATIVSAELEVVSNDNDASSANFQIRGHLSGNSPELGNDGNAIVNLPRTGATVNWNGIEGFSQGLTYQSEDVSPILQEIVNHADWCGGNAASLFIAGNGRRNFVSHEGSASNAPRLRFTYDASNLPTSGGCVSKTVVSAISASTDDAEQLTYYGNTNTSGWDLRIPYDRYEQTVGLRFNDILIPKNATITDASIEFEVDRTRTNNVSIRIHGEASDNPETYRNVWRNITSRPRTSATVLWNDVDAASANQKLEAPGLAPIVQELVNRNGWVSGNSMAFMMSRYSGRNFREVEAFDGEPANAPKLVIRYQASGTDGGPVVITARDELKEVVNGLVATGGTPIVDAYYEAASYYRGLGVDYGTKRGRFTNRHHRVSVPESYTGGTVRRLGDCSDDDLTDADCVSEQIQGNPTYISPFASSCQTNHIVFLSDGAATSNSSAAKVKSLLGLDTNATCVDGAGTSEGCGVELAQWLDETDHSQQFNGVQNISTYTIGFNIRSTFLEDIANSGGGAYFEAESANDLVNVFQTILGDVLSVDTSFVAPGATVNQFNRLTHRSDIYFALFKPDQRPTWTGNLKRYQIEEKDGEVTIVDANGDPAVDTTTGFFKDTSESHWLKDVAATGVDGNQVARGGAASNLDFSAKERKIYTYVGDYPVPEGGIDLTANEQKFHEDNNKITTALLGLGNNGAPGDINDYRHSLLQWGRGIDLQDSDEDGDITDQRHHMGDPMHARPVIINYANTGNDADTLVFVGTNEGYLHAFENVNGTEQYSFVPKDVLPNFDTFWNNQSGDGHPYGLDGTLSIWATDENENVTVDPGEKAFLYTGMRRGGDKYYALDVSDKDKPRLAWVIDSETEGFSQLGQSWSKMSPAKIRYNGDERNVLIFGAGYDENQDWTLDANRRQVPQSTDTRGRGIFIVDAITGELIYSALPNGIAQSKGGVSRFDKLDYSMPANLRILDADLDGFADQIYASDTGGQIWRFDIAPHHESGELLDGGVLADLNDGTNAGERRFYYEPDVAMISNEGERFISISIGSGWRAHPLDLFTDDRFYMIRTSHLFSKPPGYGKSTDGGATYEPITEADLVDVTNDLNAPINAFGWMYDLGATGEKVLGASVTANNQVIFSSYRPALSVGACTTAIGGGSVYALNILNGGPAVDMNQDGELTEEDREKELAHGGIPPEPALLITESGPTLLAGPEQPFQPKLDNLTRRTFWLDRVEDQATGQATNEVE